MRTNHPFTTWRNETNDAGDVIDLEALNIRDEFGRTRCAECKMPRGIHPDDEPDTVLGLADLRGRQI